MRDRRVHDYIESILTPEQKAERDRLYRLDTQDYLAYRHCWQVKGNRSPTSPTRLKALKWLRANGYINEQNEWIADTPQPYDGQFAATGK
jgi:hypothetical protein